ncbi:uncharacterized protein LOC113293767 [Papaver somniferum]|uniref:uncharacterized protein LOC113293767 n=1 Tax=Papaver somniferum TaxID=3469 RepID=UPI000E6F90BA|nr:uncharacterized protein LOC113293767 [Papaver somniferum]
MVIDHDSNLCSDRRNKRIEAGGHLRDFGQALHIPQEWRQPIEEIQLFRQHRHQRHDILRPMRTRAAPYPLEGIQLSYFTTTVTPSHINAHRVPLHEQFGTCSEIGNSSSSQRKRTRTGTNNMEIDKTTNIDDTTETPPKSSWNLALQDNNANILVIALQQSCY